jgi:hypothetical protein
MVVQATGKHGGGDDGRIGNETERIILEIESRLHRLIESSRRQAAPAAQSSEQAVPRRARMVASWSALSSSSIAPISSSSWSGRVLALAIGAVTPGWAASQASAIWLRARAGFGGDLVQRRRARRGRARSDISPSGRRARSCEIGGRAIFAGEEARGEAVIRAARRSPPSTQSLQRPSNLSRVIR